MMPPSAEEIAWAAGLFEGEGTITHSDGQLYVRLGNTDQEVIRRFADVFPFGTLYGPYEELTGIDFTCFVRAARELLAQERASQPPPPPAAAA
jgi:hypothetical protein